MRTVRGGADDAPQSALFLIPNRVENAKPIFAIVASTDSRVGPGIRERAYARIHDAELRRRTSIAPVAHFARLEVKPLHVGLFLEFCVHIRPNT